jgi:flagellar basal body rod protein FlgG
MDNLTIAIASGLRARMEAIDLVAHNLANSSTAGFKAERELTRVYFSEEALAGEDGAEAVGREQ